MLRMGEKAAGNKMLRRISPYSLQLMTRSRWRGREEEMSYSHRSLRFCARCGKSFRGTLVFVFFCTALFLGSFGCAGVGHLYERVDQLSLQGHYSQAGRYLEESSDEYAKRNRILYYLDRGMLTFAAGEFDDAIAAFRESERLMEEAFTISLSRQATTFIINDTMAPYRGEDFESVMVNVFLALSYINLGKIENALVEARKVDSKLRVLNQQYDDEHKNAYSEDPFARLLAGLCYEMGRTDSDLNDAYIAYRLALKGYEADYQRFGTRFPGSFLENILSLAQLMGAGELSEMKRRFSSVDFLSSGERSERAEVYGLHLNGRAPVKIEDIIVLPMPDGHMIKLAFPRYRRLPKEIIGARFHALSLEETGAFQAEFTLAEPIGRIAEENLENRRLRIAVKTLARVTAKYLAVKKARQEMEKEHGPLAGLMAGVIGNILTFASEMADLRCWRTLPEEILISKLSLPPGTYRLWAECLNSSGNCMQRVDLGERRLEAGDKIVVQFRTVR